MITTYLSHTNLMLCFGFFSITLDGIKPLLKSQKLEYKSIIHCKEFNVHGRIRRDNFTEMLLLVSVFVIRTMSRQLIERDKVVCKKEVVLCFFIIIILIY